MEVKVNSKAHFDMAIRTFRKKVQSEGTIREARRRRYFEKPSDKRKRKAEESLVKTRKSRKRKTN